MRTWKKVTLESLESLKRAADKITTQLRTGKLTQNTGITNTLNSDENGTYEQESN